MVIINFFQDSTKPDYDYGEYKNVAEFLKLSGMNRDELLKLRFFNGDILGKEISTENGEFLFIESGIITVIKSNTIPKGGIRDFITKITGSSSLAKILTLSPILDLISYPEPKIPNTGSDRAQAQSSTTNSLGSTNNELASPNTRIDDIFGTVTKHTPRMVQTPYRIGVNNEETEIMLLVVGRGKYQIDTNEIYDNTTRYVNIPNSAVNIFEPGTWPGNGSPSQTIGQIINRPIGIYRESASLNSTELLPPNDLVLGSSAIWSISGNGSSGTFTLTNASELDVSLLDYFTVGQNLVVLDTVVNSGITFNAYRDDGAGGQLFYDFNSTLNISGDYEITGVTSNTVTVTDFSFSFSSSSLVSNQYDVTVFKTSDSLINTYSWFLTSTDEPLTVSSTISHKSDIGQSFNNIVGPFQLDEGTETALVNLTSFSGFYKIKGTAYTTVSATVRIVVEELDGNGSPTGNQSSTDVNYNTHPTNKTSSVYQTYEVNVPYQNSRIYASRLTDRDKSEDTSSADKIEWSLLYTFKSNPAGTNFGDVTLMHCLTRSNSQSRLIKSRKTNLTLTRKITQYLGNGQFGPVESYPTSRFDQIMIHTALDPYCGRLTLDDINTDNILTLRDKIIDYSGDETMTYFGYDFDNSQVSYDDMFGVIADVVFCIPYVRDSKYDAFFEGEQTESTMQITHRNKIPESESQVEDFSSVYDGVEVTYRSNEDGETKTITVPDDGSTTSPETKELSGCTTETQALQYANRMYNRQLYQRLTVTFDVDEFGRMITPGQRIDSPDSTRFNKFTNTEDGYRVYDGEVVEVNGLQVELSQPLVFTEGENHYIQFTNSTGENSELILCTQGDDEFTVVLQDFPSQSIYDGYERDRTKFTFCSEQLRRSIALLPLSIEQSIDDDSKETNTITCKNYSALVYKDDVRI